MADVYGQCPHCKGNLTSCDCGAQPMSHNEIGESYWVDTLGDKDRELFLESFRDNLKNAVPENNPEHGGFVKDIRFLMSVIDERDALIESLRRTWIKCSERMPKKEDGRGEFGEVVWLYEVFYNQKLRQTAQWDWLPELNSIPAKQIAWTHLPPDLEAGQS